MVTEDVGLGSQQALMDELLGGTGAKIRESGLDPTLEENLCALLERDHPNPDELVHRILLAERGNHVVIGGPNPPLYRAEGKLRPFAIPGSEVDEELSDVRDGQEVFVFGIGLGEQVAYLLRTRPTAKITVWDRDPWLIRLALGRQDYHRSLASGRLTVALGADLIEHLPHLHERNVVFHPTFRGIYKDEKHLADDAISGSVPTEGRRWIGLGMGGVVVSYIADSLRREGYSIFPLEVQRWDPRETEIALRKLRPERVITVNYEEHVADACDELSIPLVVWEVDPTTDRTPTPPETSKTESIRVFTLHQSHVEQLREAGFANVEHLPLGVNIKKRYPIRSDGEVGHVSVAFVGSSLIARAARFRRLFLQLHASFDCCGMESFETTENRLESILRADRADYTTYLTGDLIEEGFSDFLEAARRSGTPDDPRKWVAEIVASQKRIAYISALAGAGVHVWGDDGWKSVEATHPGLTYRGVADPGKEVTQIYGSADINVDVNRIYQPEVIPLRVFDVLACGGFMIAEYSNALAEQFKIGDELVAYRTLDELEDMVRHYSKHPEEAARIAAAGLKAVQTRHTMRERLKVLMDSGAARS